MPKLTLNRLIRCPKCERNVKPWIVETLDAIPIASPPIPKRLKVKCAAKGCGQIFYVLAESPNAD